MFERMRADARANVHAREQMCQKRGRLGNVLSRFA